MSGISGISSTFLDLWQILSASQDSSSAAPNATRSSPNSSATTSTDPFANLNLTSSQQKQIQEIQQELQNGTISPSLAQSELKDVLSQQQLQQLQSDIQNLLKAHRHRHSQDPLSDLNLTSAQQTQINGILQAAQAGGTSQSDVIDQINKVLTSSQQQQLIAEFGAQAGSSSGATTPSYSVNTSA